jgi:hypothetical protein
LSDRDRGGDSLDWLDRGGRRPGLFGERLARRAGSGCAAQIHSLDLSDGVEQGLEVLEAVAVGTGVSLAPGFEVVAAEAHFDGRVNLLDPICNHVTVHRPKGARPPKHGWGVPKRRTFQSLDELDEPVARPELGGDVGEASNERTDPGVELRNVGLGIHLNSVTFPDWQTTAVAAKISK